MNGQSTKGGSKGKEAWLSGLRASAVAFTLEGRYFRGANFDALPRAYYRPEVPHAPANYFGSDGGGALMVMADSDGGALMVTVL
jgi:hypothetical protein